MPGLSKSEARLMGYLIMNKGKLVDKDKIFFLMGGKEEEFSLWAIYKTISRLKKKLKGKLEIRVIKDKGYTVEML
jgi:DNA-binding response OmpR family regulator